MSTQASKYTEQLGMNTGTAQNRLVKDMLFKLIVDSGLNTCHQCGEAMCRDTFTIEHKVPWRNSDDAYNIFFDLANIAFSHLSCNVGAARRPQKQYCNEEEKKVARRARDKELRIQYMLNRTPEQVARDKQKRREAYLKYGC